jgi:hypothetical protein
VEEVLAGVAVLATVLFIARLSCPVDRCGNCSKQLKPDQMREHRDACCGKPI